VLLRAAAATDADAVTAVFLASRTAALPWLPQVHSDEQTRWWVGHVVLAEHRTWVVVDGDDVVGFAALTPGHLAHLYLAPDRRRQGLGSLLLRQVQQDSPAGFAFSVFTRNTAARAFYESHGCRVIASGDGGDNEEGEPDVTYAWTP
jgi:ribosomal protein S18 acetylase RimI-like enzyme